MLTVILKALKTEGVDLDVTTNAAQRITFAHFSRVIGDLIADNKKEGDENPEEEDEEPNYAECCRLALPILKKWVCATVFQLIIA